MEDVKRKVHSIDLDEAVSVLKGYSSGTESVDHYCHFLAVVLDKGKKSPKQVAVALGQSFRIAIEGTVDENPVFGQSSAHYADLKDQVPNVVEAIFPADFAKEVLELWIKNP